MTATDSSHAPKHQIQLPLSKAWEISLKSIKIRFLRSLITASGILLGIAFFSFVRAVNLIPLHETGSAVVAEQSRHNFLAVMALLVCFVGIMNSMLMSVTERFKEIGTMKCLGALDKFIVTLFFIEAGLMGFFGSVLGWLMGWLIVVITQLLSGGAKELNGMFYKGSLLQAGESIVIGLAMTLVASIPTAVRAAQMPPAMALRSEV